MRRRQRNRVGPVFGVSLLPPPCADGVCHTPLLFKDDILVPKPTTATVTELPPTALCKHCGRQYHEHGKMGRTCMPDIGRPKGTRYVPKEEVDAELQD